jgi:hypothetical protein
MAKDGISFDKYIDNPSGGTSVITNRKMYKDLYTSKFDKILLRENGKIDFKVYKDNKSKDDSFYIHIKVPSEVIAKFYYDVVIHLSTVETTKKASTNLRQYQVKFFSNDPAFVYTFAHAFSEHHIFVEDLKPRMSKVALKSLAKTKNPTNQIFYVKSLYFAYLTMEKYSLFNRINLNGLAEPYDKKILLNNITNADIKIKERQDAQEKLDKEERDRKRKEAAEKDRNRNINHKTSSSKISKITNVSKTSKISKVSNTTRKTKIVGKS